MHRKAPAARASAEPVRDCWESLIRLIPKMKMKVPAGTARAYSKLRISRVFRGIPEPSIRVEMMPASKGLWREIARNVASPASQPTPCPTSECTAAASAAPSARL